MDSLTSGWRQALQWKVLCKVLLNRLNEKLDATLRSAQVRLQTLSAIQMTMNAFHIERESDTER